MIVVKRDCLYDWWTLCMYWLCIKRDCLCDWWTLCMYWLCIKRECVCYWWTLCIKMMIFNVNLMLLLVYIMIFDVNLNDILDNDINCGQWLTMNDEVFPLMSRDWCITWFMCHSTFMCLLLSYSVAVCTINVTAAAAAQYCKHLLFLWRQYA